MYYIRLMRWAMRAPDPGAYPISEEWDAAFMRWRDARPVRPEPLLSRLADWTMMAATAVAGLMLAVLGYLMHRRGRAL